MSKVLPHCREQGFPHLQPLAGWIWILFYYWSVGSSLHLLLLLYAEKYTSVFQDREAIVLGLILCFLPNGLTVFSVSHLTGLKNYKNKMLFNVASFLTFCGYKNLI